MRPPVKAGGRSIVMNPILPAALALRTLARRAATVFLLSSAAFAIALHSPWQPAVLLLFANVKAFLILPAAVLAAWRSIRRPLSVWTALLILFVVTMPWSAYRRPSYCGASSESRRLSIRAMSLNLAGSAGTAGRDLTRLAAEQDLDIISLQEVSPGFWRSEGAALRRSYPHTAYRESPRGHWTQAIFSRWPIRSVAYRDPGPGFTGPDTRLTLDALIEIQGRKFSVIAAHLSVPFQRAACRGLRCMFVRYHPEARNRQLQKLEQWTARRRETVVLLGDLNLSDSDTVYQHFVSPFIDAGRCAPGNAATWPSSLLAPAPVVRIDYALLREGPGAEAGASVAQAKTVRVPATDHLAVVAEFRVAPASASR